MDKNSVTVSVKLVTGDERSITSAKMNNISQICFPLGEEPIPQVAEYSISATDNNGRSVKITVSKQGVFISDLE